MREKTLDPLGLKHQFCKMPQLRVVSFTREYGGKSVTLIVYHLCTRVWFDQRETQVNLRTGSQHIGGFLLGIYPDVKPMYVAHHSVS